MIKKNIQPGFSSISFQELAKEFEEATNWLSNFGLDYKKTRIGEYKRVLDQVIHHVEMENLDALFQRHNLESISNSLYEVNEIVCISHGLSTTRGSNFSKKLEDYLKGPDSYIAEKSAASSNLGRNVAFELYTASRFALAGYRPDFETDADLKVDIDGKVLFFECKRAQVSHKIHSNIKGALKQLTERYKKTSDTDECLGVIALSISKIVNPKFQPIVTETYEEFDRNLKILLDKFIGDYRSKWEKQEDHRTIGVILYASIPSIIKSKNLITFGNSFCLVDSGSIYSEFFLKFARTIGA